MDQKWQQIKKELQQSLSRGQYDLWVSTLDFLGQKEDRLLLGCRNRFHMQWLRDKLEKQLLGMARKYFPDICKIGYQVVSDSQCEPPPKEKEGPKQINFNDFIRPSGPSFNPRFTFDQFVVGQCNQFAYAASMAMAGGQNLYNQTIYLLSETGLGKSHLSHAVANHIITQQPDLRVHYVTTEQFANEMIYALKSDRIEAFKNKFRTGCDVLLLERIEFLSGKEKVQNELVYTLDELLDRGKKVLCTGSAYPKDIPRLNNELKSRLGGLMVAPIERPDFRTRVEIIKRKAYRENIRLPMDVVEFFADHIVGDVRQLESCLIGMIAKTNILGVPITLPLAEEVAQTMLDRLPKISVKDIQDVVCTSFQIALEDLRSSSRRKELTMARKIAMYLCRQYTSESLVSIGKSFKRSHSSVLYAVNGLHKQMGDKSGKLKRQIEYLSRRLETSCLSA